MAAEINVHRMSRGSELPRLQQQSELDYDNEFSTSSPLAAVSASTVTTNRRRRVNGDPSPITLARVTSGGGSPRRSWEESFQSLSRNLQMICGSNGSIDEATSPPGCNGSCAGGGDCGSDFIRQQRMSVTGMAPVLVNGLHDQGQSVHRSNTASMLPTPATRVSGGVTVCSQPLPVQGSHVEVQRSAVGAVDAGSTSPLCRSPVAHQQQILGGDAGGHNRNTFPFQPPTTGSSAFAAGRFPPILGCSPGAVSAVTVRPGWRPVRVHHEETTDRLRQSLTKICLQPSSSNSSSANGSPSTSTSGGLNQEGMISSGCGDNGEILPVVDPASQRCPDDSMMSSTSESDTKSRQLRMKESLKSGVRVRLDLVEVGCDPDYVVVAVRTNPGDGNGSCGDRFLTVWNAATATTTTTPQAYDSSASPKEHLVSVKLPKQTIVTALTCYVTEARILYVRERTKETMYAEVDPPDSELFVPVQQEDESQLTVAVTLHVADHFHFEDLAVRTIDDRLVIKGRRGLGVPTSPDGSSLAGGADGRLQSSPDRDMSYISGTFTVVLALPEGTYTRTVRAAFAPKERQLIVTAARAPASRRMTCAF